MIYLCNGFGFIHNIHYVAQHANIRLDPPNLAGKESYRIL